jgi:molybdenum cofactor cytidylyltransferase
MSVQKTIPAIILAAGASRRLGEPKQLVRVDGETLLDRTIRIVRESGVETVFVVLGAHHERIASCADLKTVHSIFNKDWEQGIATSIQAGVRAVQEACPDAGAVMLLVCDQPRLSSQHLRALIETHARALEPAIVASSYAGIAGIPAIFPAGQFAELSALCGDSGAKLLLRNPRCALVEVPFAGGEVDVDTPADLAAMDESSD